MSKTSAGRWPSIPVETVDVLRQPAKARRERIPAVFESYGALNAAVLSDGALAAKTKELLALAIAVTNRTVTAPSALEAFQGFSKK